VTVGTWHGDTALPSAKLIPITATFCGIQSHNQGKVQNNVFRKPRICLGSHSKKWIAGVEARTKENLDLASHQKTSVLPTSTFLSSFTSMQIKRFGER
jgi:hypothetical protein